MKTFLPADLEDEGHGLSDREWHAKALRTLASQLGVTDDYYFPLLGAAKLIEEK